MNERNRLSCSTIQNFTLHSSLSTLLLTLLAAVRLPDQRMYENQRQQNQAVADMVNEELRLKNLKQQQLVSEVKANYAEEQKKKKLEEQTKEAERQLEVRKEIAAIRQTNVKSMSFTDVRQMYSNVETLTLKLRELEKAGQNNSKEYRESKEKLNAYIAKLKEAGIAMDGFKNASSRAKSVLSSDRKSVV